MALRRKYVSSHVVVEPRAVSQYGMTILPTIHGDEGERKRKWRAACQAISDQIKRHVDDLGDVLIVDEMQNVCSHCGAEWTESPDSPHNGGCCDSDHDAYLAAGED